ncbi:MAG: hypothetical protein AAFX99_31465, partial [Myxococcota bacterium]
EDDVWVDVYFRSNSFDARADFLEGELKGQSWGLQSWRSYVIDAQGQTHFVDNDDIAFILPAIHYLQEFSFRALDHTVVAYMGTETIDGVKWERVMVTWGLLAPNLEHDQYVAYIHPESGRVEKIQYTVRDIMRIMTGTIHFSDFREVDGLWLPFTQAITLDPDGDPDTEFAHRITVQEMVLDPVPVAFFRQDQALGQVGNAKVHPRE